MLVWLRMMSDIQLPMLPTRVVSFPSGLGPRPSWHPLFPSRKAPWQVQQLGLHRFGTSSSQEPWSRVTSPRKRTRRGANGWVIFSEGTMRCLMLECLTGQADKKQRRRKANKLERQDLPWADFRQLIRKSKRVWNLEVELGGRLGSHSIS